jgi:hypothetical protein
MTVEEQMEQDTQAERDEPRSDLRPSLARQAAAAEAAYILEVLRK